MQKLDIDKILDKPFSSMINQVPLKYGKNSFVLLDINLSRGELVLCNRTYGGISIVRFDKMCVAAYNFPLDYFKQYKDDTFFTQLSYEEKIQLESWSLKNAEVQ